MTRDHSTTAVVLLIHRAQDLGPLRDAVRSALENGVPEGAVTIVDNGSGLAADLDREFPRCIILHAGRNLGFAGGNNAGIRRTLGAGAAFVLLLNNDATLAPGALTELLAAMRRHPDAGAVQPLIYRTGGSAIDSAGQQPIAKGGAIDLERRPAGDGPDVEIFGPCAAAALYRGEVLERTGVFDDSFFMIHEDTDLSMRMRLDGFRSYLVIAAAAFHARGVSGEGNRRSPHSQYHAGRNNLVILLRYWPLRHLLFYLPFHLVRYGRVLVAAVQCHRSVAEVHRMLRRALRDRRRYARSGLLPPIHERWFATGCYRALVFRSKQKETP